MRSMSIGLVCAALAACNASQPPAKNPPRPKVEEAPRAESELYLALSALPNAPPVLEALPKALQATLEAEVHELSTEQRGALLDGSDPAASHRPLLYLTAGGRDLAVLSLLFSSPAASHELLALHARNEDKQSSVSWVELSNALAERAALRFLRERAVDVSSLVTRQSEHLQQIALAARVLSRLDLERLALVELLAGKHQSPEAVPEAETKLQRATWQLALAQVEARALRPTEAERRWELAKAGGANERPAALANARLLIEAARLLHSANVSKDATTLAPSNVDEAVAWARAALELGHVELAKRSLQAQRGELGRHLAYSTESARVATHGSACPRLLPTVSTETLCRYAWLEHRGHLDLTALERAWQSGRGRDLRSVEAFLGLVYVVPMMYGVDEQGKPADVAWVERALETLEQRAREANAMGPQLEAIALLSHGLSALVAHAPGPGASAATEAQRKQLLAAASALLTKHGEQPWVHAASLGTCALVAQHERLAPVLDQLERHDVGVWSTTLGTLQLWDVLADADLERFSRLRTAFGDLALASNVAPFERSKWLFLWAEAEAHLAPSGRTFETLRRIAENLQAESVPLDLRLRAALDLAGLRARSGDYAGAALILSPVLEGLSKSSVSTLNEQELYIAASAYLWVVRGLNASGAERNEFAQKLETLLLDVARANAAPPSLQMWMMMWRSEFDAAAALDACNGKRACRERVERQRGADFERVAAALGPRVAELLRRGVLPVGGAQIELTYQGRGQLQPHIDVSPQFLLAHVPPFANAKSRR